MSSAKLLQSKILQLNGFTFYNNIKLILYNMRGLLNDSADNASQVQLRHIEKVHFQIEVSNRTLIDKLIFYAIEKGGTCHEDSEGRVYLFYPVLRKGIDKHQELCLIHETGCDLSDKISYHNGQDELKVTGNIIYAHHSEQSGPQFNQQDDDSEKVTFIILDNFKSKSDKKSAAIVQRASTFSKQSKSSLHFADSDTDMKSMDAAICEMCKILKKKNKKSMDFMSLILAIPIMFPKALGLLCNTLFYYWLVTDNGSFGTTTEVFIYIGFLIATILQDYTLITFLIKTAEASENFCVKLFAYILLLALGPLQVAISYWQFKNSHYDPVYQKHLIWNIVVAAIIAALMYYILKRVNWEDEQEKKLSNFLKFSFKNRKQRRKLAEQNQ
ncbi:hypothetical protein FGO68_gene9036 [Halteria grandinella]|uniref:Transmembrane protein n=1 Tax=Halteria grandinella TaxID=5974 RepID=A0A8J8T144_HALGN|nr:hypothetical protein FGO68_gene9036 [Halteria grandinella]